MVWNRLETAKIYHKYAEMSQGDVIVEGFFIGTTDGRFGCQHTFRSLEGVHHVLNSAGHLNYCLEQIAVGNFARITYNGETVLTKGPMAGKKSHQFLIDIDPTVKMGADPVPVEFEEVQPPTDDDILF